MDLRKLSTQELEALIRKAQQRKAQIARRRIGKVRARIEKILKAEGLGIEDVFARAAAKPAPAARPRRAATTRGSKVPPKYRNPDDPGQTWAGRGMKPRWFVEALAAGRSEDELRIR